MRWRATTRRRSLSAVASNAPGSGWCAGARWSSPRATEPPRSPRPPSTVPRVTPGVRRDGRGGAERGRGRRRSPPNSLCGGCVRHSPRGRWDESCHVDVERVRIPVRVQGDPAAGRRSSGDEVRAAVADAVQRGVRGDRLGPARPRRGPNSRSAVPSPIAPGWQPASALAAAALAGAVDGAARAGIRVGRGVAGRSRRATSARAGALRPGAGSATTPTA